MPTITVRLDRGIAAVVQAIKSRLLPEYLRILVLAQKKVPEPETETDLATMDTLSLTLTVPPCMLIPVLIVFFLCK